MLKQIAVINDLSSFGACSLSAAMAVLPAMGHRVCPLPTAVLSAQSEFPVYASQDLTALMPRYTDAWRRNGERFDGICTGYFASAAQLQATEAFLSRFHTDSTLLFVDPVMGDNGALYPAYDRAACEEMKRLAARADVLTPNLTELCLLTGADYTTLTGGAEQIAALAKPLAQGRSVAVTGIPDGGSLCNLIVQNGDTAVVRAKRAGGRYSGTGDLFAAVMCGGMLHGKTAAQAAQTAARFVALAAEEAARQPVHPRYGVPFERCLPILLNEVTCHANDKNTEKIQTGAKNPCAERHVCRADNSGDGVY